MIVWKPGTQVVIRGVVHNRVWIALSTTVVQDTDGLLVTYLVPGAPCKVSQGLIERKWGGTENGSSRWAEQDGRQWQLSDWTWKYRRVLALMLPAKYYAVLLFWLDNTDEFEAAYINFQMPYRKTEWTIDTLDLELDLIIKPDGTHHWKDEAEYLEGVRRGSIPADSAARVDEAREEVLKLLSTGSPLFDRKWLDWRTDPGWGIPQLHPTWETVIVPQSR